jgi:hypothetical protein
MEAAVHGGLTESGPAHSAFLSFYQGFWLEDDRNPGYVPDINYIWIVPHGDTDK